MEKQSDSGCSFSHHDDHHHHGNSSNDDDRLNLTAEREQRLRRGLRYFLHVLSILNGDGKDVDSSEKKSDIPPPVDDGSSYQLISTEINVVQNTANNNIPVDDVNDEVEKKKRKHEETSGDDSSKKTIMHQESIKLQFKRGKNLDNGWSICSASTSSNTDYQRNNLDQENLDETLVSDENPTDHEIVDHPIPAPPAVDQAGPNAPILFFEKVLTISDVSDQQSRLSMPVRQVVDDSFFSNEEKERLMTILGVGAVLIDPRGIEYDIVVKINRVGKTCDCYWITRPWKYIRRDNEFQAGTVVRLSAFRRDGGVLCFNLTV